MPKSIYLFVFASLAFCACKNEGHHNHSHGHNHGHETSHAHAHDHPHHTEAETGVIHTVYFWLKDDVSEEDRKTFEQALNDLAKVPSISEYYWGKPAGTEARDVTDQSFDYAINVFFDSVEDEAAYQIDPLHLKFVEAFGKIFETVKVYDNTY